MHSKEHREPSPGQNVIPFVGVLLNPSISHSEFHAWFQSAWAEVEHQSDVVPFDSTDYYRDEMGKDLRRFWLQPDESWTEDVLSGRKHFGNKLEAEAAEQFPVASRPVNLDPGYVRDNQVVLASTKDAGHRLFIGQNIYAELTLIYEDGGFQPFTWTYPDYQSDAASSFFRKCRNQYFSRFV